MEPSGVEKVGEVFDAVLAISSMCDPDDMLARALEWAVSIAGADGGGVIVRNHNNEWAMKTSIGEKESDAGLCARIFIDYLTERVLVTGRAVRLDGRQIKDFTGLSARALICAPIMNKTEVFGILAVYNMQNRQDFSEFDELALMFLAGFVANYLSTGFLPRVANPQRDLSAIDNIARVLNTKPDLEDLYNEVVCQIGLELKCTHCTLFLSKRTDGKEFFAPRAAWPSDRKNLLDRKFKRDEGLIGLVYSENRSQIFTDAANHPSYVGGLTKPGYHPRSILISPIKSSDVIIGVICVDLDEINGFTENDLRLVDSLAVQMGIAIERSLVYKALKKISEQLIGTLNPEYMNYVLEMVLETGVELTAATSGVIHLLDDDKRQVIESKAYPEGSYHPQPRIDEKGNFIGLTGEAIRQKKGFVISGVDLETRVNPALRSTVRSMAVYPLISQNEVIGVLYIDDAEGHKFTKVEKLVLETLANQVGIAITSNRLIQELEESREEFQNLYRETVEARDMIINKMFYAQISHSVKNVLAQIALNLDLIATDPAMQRVSKHRRDRLNELSKEIEKNTMSIVDFLDLTMESERETKDYKVCSLINHAIRLLEGKIKTNNVNLDISGIDPNLTINVNRAQMIMVFQNLIDNAVDALIGVNRSRVLKIYTDTGNATKVEISFEDNGSGISNENLGKLFGPYFSTKAKKGRGIGLLASRRIVETHNGKLPKPFSHLGKGTKFTVYLPKK